jgi:hypothetical protein
MAGEMSKATGKGGKRPRIYAASRASVPERVAMWQNLRERGVCIVSTWIDEAEPGATADLGQLWVRIAGEIGTSDRLVLYVQPEDFPLKGALIEVGIALAFEIPIFLVSPGCVFSAPSYRPIGSWIKHPLVSIAANLDAAVLP